MEKYEITKEQILELENGFTLPKLKQWFPDAFKTELEVGKWYKENKANNFMFCFQGIYSRYESSKAYGFTLSGKWYENLGVDKESTYFEATEQEVKNALENEAIKRGFVDKVYFNEILDDLNAASISDTGHCAPNFKLQNGNLYSIGRGKWCLFKKGKWANIIETITKKEAEEKLGVKII